MARSVIVVVTLLAIVTGCDGDAKYRELTDEASRRQAEQNQRMADVQNQANATVQAGIESNDRARQAIAAQGTDVREQMNQLDNERQKIAAERHWDASNHVGDPRHGNDPGRRLTAATGRLLYAAVVPPGLDQRSGPGDFH